MRILSIDPSLSSTGWAVLDNDKIVCYGHIKAPKTEQEHERINYITKELKLIFSAKECEYIGIEKLVLFRANSSTTILKLAGLYYHLLCEFGKRNYLICELMAVEWRARLGIKGKSRTEAKENTIKYVHDHYGNIEVTEDEADAICIGLASAGEIW